MRKSLKSNTEPRLALNVSRALHGEVAGYLMPIASRHRVDPAHHHVFWRRLAKDATGSRFQESHVSHSWWP